MMQETRSHQRRHGRRYPATAGHTSASGTLALRSLRSHEGIPGRSRSYLPIRDTATSANGYKKQYALWLESRQLREPPGSRLAAAYKEHRSELSPADELVSALRSHIGYWVAVRGSEVLTSAESARDVITFLRERRLFADSVFRVPADPWGEMGEG